MRAIYTDSESDTESDDQLRGQRGVRASDPDSPGVSSSNVKSKFEDLLRAIYSDTESETDSSDDQLGSSSSNVTVTLSDSGIHYESDTNSSCTCCSDSATTASDDNLRLRGEPASASDSESSAVPYENDYSQAIPEADDDRLVNLDLDFDDHFRFNDVGLGDGVGMTDSDVMVDSESALEHESGADNDDPWASEECISNDYRDDIEDCDPGELIEMAYSDQLDDELLAMESHRKKRRYISTIRNLKDKSTQNKVCCFSY